MSVRVITFGCRLNTYESAAMQELEHLPENIIIVNTCAVTAEAERQCKQAIRKIRRENPESFLVVTGCAVQISPEVYAVMPEVDRVLGNKEKLLSSSFLPTALDVQVSDISIPADITSAMPIFFEGRNRAFIQIQQGCDHACTFCIVPNARGKNVPLPATQIVTHAQTLIDSGYSELNLTGVDISAYPDLSSLVSKLLKEVTGLKRLRLGSLDPASVQDSLLDLFGQDERLCPHIHLSVQAGDDLILKRMARRHNRRTVIDVCEKAVKIRPDFVFGADFITGFPTETDAMFENTCALVQQIPLTHLHVFPYSVRPGTPAAKMPQVPVPVRKERAKHLRTLGGQLLTRYMHSRIDTNAVVLYETEGKGLCEHYLSVKINADAKSGDYVAVRLTNILENGVFEGSVL